MEELSDNYDWSSITIGGCRLELDVVFPGKGFCFALCTLHLLLDLVVEGHEMLTTCNADLKLEETIVALPTEAGEMVWCKSNAIILVDSATVLFQ